mgnify:CR=1 FL=1
MKANVTEKTYCVAELFWKDFNGSIVSTAILLKHYHSRFTKKIKIKSTKGPRPQYFICLRGNVKPAVFYETMLAVKIAFKQGIDSGLCRGNSINNLIEKFT